MKKKILILTISILLMSLNCGGSGNPNLPSQALAALGFDLATGQLKLSSGESSNLNQGKAYRFSSSGATIQSQSVKALAEQNSTVEGDPSTVDLIQGQTSDGWLLVIRTNKDSDIMLSKGPDLFIAKGTCEYSTTNNGSLFVTISSCTLAKVSNKQPSSEENSDDVSSSEAETIVLSGTISLSANWINLETDDSLINSSNPGIVKAQDLNDPLCLYSIYALYMEYTLGTQIQALLSQWWNPFALYAAYQKLILLKFWVTENGKYQSYCWN
ncbi:hypothetical protein EHQ61_16380 [Leptospira wolffii]|uniref:hypothetical protein n=1 Tax=Leptospira wolffii TaxID=409998 RepID=UPI0010824A65|nr:hypothetical protein [Leptospira wolffii]TGL46328.1 hypothetical protein EHQ61_16380 [Leptospira wolffii]